MIMLMKKLVLIASLCLVAAVGILAEVAVDEQPHEATASALDAIHEDLVGLRFEKALAAIEALLGDTSLSVARRAQALVLRAQTHVAFGDLNAAEADYRAILELRPGYVPEPSLTPSKAMKRFDRVQAKMIGRLAIVLDPEDARLEVDGVEIVPTADGGVPLLAGEHTVEARRKGFDPMAKTVLVQAGSQASVELQLVPNSRSVWIYTIQDDVEVTLDGSVVGRTRRPSGAEFAGRPAELLLEELPPGEHLFEMSKPCFRSERRQDNLTIDLLDRGPKRYAPMDLVPQRSTLVLVGGPATGEVVVGGRTAGSLPLDPLEMCPGTYPVEVRHGSRTIWRSVEQLVPSRETVVDVEPRPNVVLVGLDGWPATLEPLASGFNVVTVDAPSSGAPSTVAEWKGVELDPGTDLAFVARSGGDGWDLFSPVLQVIVTIQDAVPALIRPRWNRGAWGFQTTDSRIGGRATVVQVVERGPAFDAGLKVGDRIVSIGGSEVAGAHQIRDLLGFLSSRAPLAVEWQSDGGKQHKAELKGHPTTFLDPGPHAPAQAVFRAAWARVDAAVDRERPAALANLAMLLAEFDRHAEAAQVWRRVGWSERPGIGKGTAQYFLARELELLGAEEDAVRAFRFAAESEATAIDDEGPRIGPAARDRLTDLGVGDGR